MLQMKKVRKSEAKMRSKKPLDREDITTKIRAETPKNFVKLQKIEKAEKVLKQRNKTNKTEKSSINKTKKLAKVKDQIKGQAGSANGKVKKQKISK